MTDTKERRIRVTAVAGNPKSRSRTLEAAVHLAADIAGVDIACVTSIDVVDHAAALIAWDRDALADVVRSAAENDVLVVASPTYKATYTGLLKLFFEQFPTRTGLSGVVAVPLMLGAGAAHALAPELLLKPLLVEVGATVPCQGLYLSDQAYLDSAQRDEWLQTWRPILLDNVVAGAR